MFDAIAAIHCQALVLHRDIKPDNFRIQDNQVKIIDFGLMTEFIINGSHILEDP
jgi:serine/threonine protein kinase